MMASVVANGNRKTSLSLKGVDPETCMIVFRNHWAQVVKILEKHDPVHNSGGGCLRLGPIPGDEASAVQNYVEHMLLLLMEEESSLFQIEMPFIDLSFSSKANPISSRSILCEKEAACLFLL
ncbi:FHF complex subunit HOOK-interacting protein 1A-like [Salvelinus sp. IW2-2015]|uniref:FHF complex subunit HOOK-interacting protein 1A-like n=1 Tax=Salvelinus sp. IW2-2015 TaxID=2691554 RepID=UPI000CEAAABE|nr:protein FAM160A1-like [Salvelinus alpinus]